MFHRAIAVAAGMFAATVATAQTEVPFALDWKFEGPSAAYFAAIDNGHFEAEGLSVTIEAGSGSVQTIPKIATGAFPMGFALAPALMFYLLIGLFN